MDATATDRAVDRRPVGRRDVGLLKLAADHPERVRGRGLHRSGCRERAAGRRTGRGAAPLLRSGPGEPAGLATPERRTTGPSTTTTSPSSSSTQCFNEPHSTKPREDCVRWALETTPEVLLADAAAAAGAGDGSPSWAERVTAADARDPRRPGSDQPARAWTRSSRNRRGGELVVLEGAGHIPLARDPVRVNLLIRDFVDRIAPTPEPRPRRSWVPGPRPAQARARTSRRPSGSVMRDATSPSPTSSASSIPTSRSSGSRQTR